MADQDWLSGAIDTVGRSTQAREQRATSDYEAWRRTQDAAQAAALSRSTGLPPETVARNRGVVEQDRAAQRDRSAISSQPGLQAWLTQNPVNPASAQGDAELLAASSFWFGPAGRDAFSQGVFRPGQPSFPSTSIDFLRKRSAAEILRSAQATARGKEERTAAIERNRPRASARSVTKGLAVDTVEGLRQSWIGTKLFLADAVGIPESSPVFSNILKEQERSLERATAYRPRVKGATAEAVYGGASSFLQTLPALAAAPFTDGTSLLTLFGTQAGTRAYGKYRARGGTANEALLGGTLEGGIEAATELLPTRFLTSRFGKGGAGAFVVGYLGRDMLGEQVATLGQDAVDTAIANPNASWAQYLADRPRAAFDTAVASVMASGALGGGSAIVRSLRKADTDVRDAAEAMTGQRFLDQAIALATESKMRQADPEGFQDFVRSQTAGSPIENVYVPGEVVRELMQSE